MSTKSSANNEVEGDLLEKRSLTMPVMQLPGGKLLIITTTHTTRIVDDPRAVPGDSRVPISQVRQAAANVVAEDLGHDANTNRPVVATLKSHKSSVEGKKRTTVKNACVACHERHKTCESVRPCQRCLKVGVECQDRVRKSALTTKKRRHGAVRPRGRSRLDEQPESATASTSAVTLDATELTMYADDHGVGTHAEDGLLVQNPSWNDIEKFLAEYSGPLTMPSWAGDHMLPDPLHESN